MPDIKPEAEQQAVVILFGGGDGGGLKVGPDGVKRIPPFNPELAAAIGHLSFAAEKHGELRKTADEAMNLLAQQIGMVEMPAPIVYVGDDAPWCGTSSDGKFHPHPLHVAAG